MFFVPGSLIVHNFFYTYRWMLYNPAKDTANGAALHCPDGTERGIKRFFCNQPQFSKPAMRPLEHNLL